MSKKKQGQNKGEKEGENETDLVTCPVPVERLKEG
jgi:hypothetical protein